MRNALRDPKWLKMTEDDRAERKATKEAKREGVKRRQISSRLLILTMMLCSFVAFLRAD